MCIQESSAQEQDMQERIRELEAKTRAIEEENYQLKLDEDSLKEQLKENLLQLQAKDAEIQQLTNQNVEHVKIAADQQRKIAVLTEEIEALQKRVVELESRQKDKDKLSELDDCEAANTDFSSSTESQQTESSDDEYKPVPFELISKLKRFCEDLSIENCRVLQNPHNWQEITVLGTEAKMKLADVLDDFYSQNLEFRKKGYNVKVLDRKWTDSTYQLSLQFSNTVETKATCGLIVETSDKPDSVFAMGPAHMLFCDSANKEFKKNCDIRKIRDDIDHSQQASSKPIIRQVQLRSSDPRRVTELKVTGTPYIAYRYQYRAEETPTDSEDPKLYRNDLALLRCDERKHKMAKCVETSHWWNKEILELSRSALQVWNCKPIKINNFKGKIFHFEDIDDIVERHEGIYFTFTLNSEKEKSAGRKLKEGDSGSIVYAVRNVRDANGNESETLEPLGMLVECIEKEEEFRGYSALLLHQALADISSDYESLGRLTLFKPPPPLQLPSSGPRPPLQML